MRFLLILVLGILLGCEASTVEQSTASSNSNDDDGRNRNNGGSKDLSAKGGGDGGKSGNGNEGVSGFIAGDRFTFEVLDEDSDPKIQVTINPGAFSNDIDAATVLQPELSDVKKIADGATLTAPSDRILGSWDMPQNRSQPYSVTYPLQNTSDPIVVVGSKSRPVIIDPAGASRGFDVFGTFASAYGSSGSWMTSQNGFGASLFSLGGSHSLFWKHSEDRFYATGINTYSQLGIAQQFGSHYATPIVESSKDGSNLNPNNNPVKVQSGTGNNLGLRTNYSGILLASGDLLTFGNLGIMGLNGIGEEDPGHGLSRVLAPQGVLFVDFSLGSVSSCALSTDFKVFCWGNNNSQQMISSVSYSLVPLETSFSANGGRAKAISSRYEDTCLINMADDQIYCIGKEWGPSLQKVPVDGGASVKFKTIDTGRKHFCALSEDDFVYCAGNNEERQVDGAMQENRPLVKVTASVDYDYKVRDLAVGPYFNCLLTFDSEVFCWGNNDHGETQDGMGFLNGKGGERISVDLRSIDSVEIFDIEVGSASQALCIHAEDGYHCMGNVSNRQLGIDNQDGLIDEVSTLEKVPNLD